MHSIFRSFGIVFSPCPVPTPIGRPVLTVGSRMQFISVPRWTRLQPGESIPMQQWNSPQDGQDHCTDAAVGASNHGGPWLSSSSRHASSVRLAPALLSVCPYFVHCSRLTTHYLSWTYHDFPCSVFVSCCLAWDLYFVYCCWVRLEYRNCSGSIHLICLHCHSRINNSFIEYCWHCVVSMFT